MIINGMAGGGTRSNYTFAVYSASGSIPTGITENSIASVTSTAVPAGGVMYRENFPTVRDTGAALQVGDVVIMKHKRMVFQYTGTSWISLYTKICTNGVWKMFFDPWEARGWAAGSGFAPANPTLTVGSDTITISEPEGYSGVFRLLNDIDLTPFSTVRVRASTTANGSTSYAGLYVVAKTATYYDTNATAKLTFTGAIASRSINVSALNARYDVILGAAASVSSSSITFEQVELVL